MENITGLRLPGIKRYIDNALVSEHPGSNSVSCEFRQILIGHFFNEIKKIEQLLGENLRSWYE